MSKTLVVYYSHSGNAKILAEQITALINADHLELNPVEADSVILNGISKHCVRERMCCPNFAHMTHYSGKRKSRTG